MNVFPYTSTANRKNSLQRYFILFTEFCRTGIRRKYENYIGFFEFSEGVAFSSFGRSGGYSRSLSNIFISVVLFKSFWVFFSHCFAVCAFTRFATTRSIFLNAQIIATKRMSFVAVGHSRSLRAQRITPKNICSLSNCFQMPWIYATFVLTQMIHHVFIWNWSFIKFVTKTMPHYFFIWSTINNRIAIAGQCAWVKPTLVWIAVLFKIPKVTFESEVVHG